MTRSFVATPAKLEAVPLLIGMMGPPGGGKTLSAIRLAAGMARVRGGKFDLYDTEGGRSLKYRHGPHNLNGHDFNHYLFKPPFKPEDFLTAIRQSVANGAAAVVIDSGSDEWEGEMGVLDWHDKEVPRMGGNDFAAWSKPKESQRALLTGLQQITTPIIWTFRAREKTVQQKDERGKNVPVAIGLQPVASMELIHTLDLTCLLPARAEGVPIWHSPKGAEDFVIKYPEFLRAHIREGVLREETGEALARWAMGDTAPAMDVDAWRQTIDTVIDEAADAKALHERLSAALKSPEYAGLKASDPAMAKALRDKGAAKVAELKGSVT